MGSAFAARSRSIRLIRWPWCLVWPPLGRGCGIQPCSTCCGSLPGCIRATLPIHRIARLFAIVSRSGIPSRSSRSGVPSWSHIVLKLSPDECAEGVSQHRECRARHRPGLGRVEQDGAYASSEHRALLLLRYPARAYESSGLEFVEGPCGRCDAFVGCDGLVELFADPISEEPRLVDEIDAARWSVQIGAVVLGNMDRGPLAVSRIPDRIALLPSGRFLGGDHHR